MDCTALPPFRRTAKGNFYAQIDGRPCTVFQGPYGGWSYFIDGERADRWYDDEQQAMADVVDILAAVRDAMERRRRQAAVPVCFKFFGLTPPVTRDSLMAKYRELARKTHPDAGGTCEAFKTVQRHLELALQLVGGAA